MELLYVALRNVTRNRRRSALTIVALSVGVTMLFCAQGLIRGFSESLYENMTVLDTGHVQVEQVDYRADARRLPLDLSISEAEGLSNTIKKVEGVGAVTKRIDFMLEITNGREGMRSMGRGIDPEAEAQVTSIKAHLKQGCYLASGQPGLLLGKRMAEKLGLGVGSTAWFTALDRHAVRNLGAMPVSGIFETGYPVLDERMVFMDLSQAGQFLAMDKTVTRLVVKAKADETSDDLAARIAKAIAYNPSVHTYDWKVFAETLVSTIKSRVGFLSVLLGILFLLIVSGIANTMAMSVRERYREIGTLRAIGMRSRSVTLLLLVEGLWLAVIASAIALVVGGLIALYTQLVGFDLSQAFPSDMPLPFGSRIRARYQISDFLVASGSGGLAAAIGSLFPARRAGRLKVTEVLSATR